MSPFEHFRIADALDILVVAAVIFVALTLLRRRSFRAAVAGLGILLAVLLTANATDMVMTRWLAQGLIVLLGVTAVVVFQGDLRNAFDRLTAFRLPGRRRTDDTSALAELFSSACARMGELHMGALLAFQGREDWERFLTGGVPLDARPSEPLLLSLFQTSSPAHDGAVLVERGRLTRFGVHLPLSRNLAAVGSGGTRHTAALGLSECADALVVVVSEERGTLSVARSSRLREVGTAELHRELDDFLRDERRRPMLTEGTRLRTSLLAAAASLLTAAVLWFLIVDQAATVTRRYDVPLEFRNLPADKMLVDDDPQASVQVVLAGRETDFNQLDEAQLALSFDLGDLEVGPNQLDLRQGELRRARGLSLQSVTPTSMDLEVAGLEVAAVTVEPRTTGSLPAGLELQDITCEPATVQVWIPRAEGRPTLTTAPIDLSAVTETSTMNLRLVVPEDCRRVEGEPEQVAVTVQVKEG